MLRKSVVRDSDYHSITSKRKSLDLANHCRLRKVCALFNARVVEWQTRTFEGRMPKGIRVQVPPRHHCIALAVAIRR